MARFRCKTCPGEPGEGGSSIAADVRAIGRRLRQASVGTKTRSAGREPTRRTRGAERMDLSFTGRGVRVTEDIRMTAERKLAPLERLEPRTMRIEVEVINEHHPRLDGLKRVEAALRIPRKTFRAEAEAEDVPTAIDRVKDKLERQLRDHHGRRRLWKQKRGLESALTYPEAEPSAEQEE
jgi:ribosomal subunit interface protein